jgi:ubiquinone/menaquinone biosynthesis C-methylase UbiE
MSRQKDAFLHSEGDAWLARNEAALASCDWSRDPVCVRVESLLATTPRARVLEIGCGDGSRLQQIAHQQGREVRGIDPSAQAVARARARGVDAVRATADRLPCADASNDVVIFGFCLYLCDDADLFRIAQEADRVLASCGWLLILDFEARAPVYHPYKHLAGLVSRKMDYKSMFLWHPAYTLASYEKFHHHTREWSDEPDEWVSLACLRKLGNRQ